MTTFNIESTPTKYKEILDSIIEQGHALKSLHNPQTWRLTALTFALHLYDCTILFENLRDRWKEHLPFSEAWDVNFADWKNKIWSAVIDTNSFTSNEEFSNWKKLCKSDINDFVIKASECLNGNVPISDVLEFLKDKETELFTVVVNMGQALSVVLSEIDSIPMTATKEQFIDYYNNLLNIYVKENEDNPYPIKVGNEVISFDKWIASKTEKQRNISIPNKINSIHSNMLTDKTWNELWEENVFLDQRTLDKEGIGRAIFPMRKTLIENEKAPINETMYELFSSLALCSHLWEYESNHNANALDNLSELRLEILKEVETLIEKGEWKKPVTADQMKIYIRTVLGVGSQKLVGDDENMSKTLWELFEGNNRVRITFQNLIGYFSTYKLLPEGRGSDLLNRKFFDPNAKTYQNIDHGRPTINNKNMPRKFQSILPLLDKYRPK